MNKPSKKTIVKESVEWYIKNQPLYKLLSKKVENIIRELIEIEAISYHAIFSRAKEIESFSNKISTKDYSNPQEDVTDLAGIRIITYVESEVEPICKIIEDNFDIDTDNSHNKSDDLGIDKVGYKSVHYIAKLKKERLLLPEYKRFENKFFEIQVRTILQHAWAEIEHDKNYKFTGKLPIDLQRRFKLLAGALESADREFNSISLEIDNISKQVEIATKKGELDIPINTTSLKQYMSTKFAKLYQRGLTDSSTSERELIILSELDKYGVKTLANLDAIIPKDFIKNELFTNASETMNALLIDIMIIKDYKKYFETVWSIDHWGRHSKNSVKLFELYNVPVKELEEKYNITIEDD